MTTLEFAQRMFPFWILGAGMIWATVKAGYKDVLRIEKDAAFKFLRFMLFVTLFRIAMFKLFGGYSRSSGSAVSVIPWPVTLTVFWEDAAHTLPLFLIRSMMPKFRGSWLIHSALLLVTMLEFGLGHVYQGAFSAFLLSFYIPYTLKQGPKFGFGTVMVCHTLFDLITILTVKAMLGV